VTSDTNPTAGALIYEVLKKHRVTCLFGMEDPIHITHAADPDFTRIVTVRDEKHGAIMAHGYAQATGRTGVCAATSGPGATNLITGLLEALHSSVPVVALVQDHPTAVKGRNAASELDHAAALGPFTKAVLRIDRPEDSAEITDRAFHLATIGRPGPVAVLCPTDVVSERVAPADARALPNRDNPAPLPDPTAIAAAARLLTGAERPVLIAGGGCHVADAAPQVIALAERFAAPIATTMTGRGIVADAHPLAIGPIGSTTGGKLGRGRVANAFLGEADVVLIMGSRTGQICYSDWTLPRPDARIIHIDIDPKEIGRNFATEIALVGDVRETLTALEAECARAGLAAGRRDDHRRIAAMKDAWADAIAPLSASPKQPIKPERLLAEIDSVVTDDTLIVTDASFVTGWGLSQITVPKPGRFALSPRGTSGIGWALPAAMGAKLGDPARQVICLSGDGAFGYVMAELETAKRHDINILVVVFNNGTLAFQRHYEERVMGSYRDCDFLDVDYSEVGRALKCDGERVVDPRDIAAALARGLAVPGPYVLDVVIDPESKAPVISLETE